MHDSPPDDKRQDHTSRVEGAPTADRGFCPYCGATCRPTLSQGRGPHAIRADCGHCGRFLKWISILAPSERMARRMKERLKAMQRRPPSQAQMEYLRALGDQLTAPGTMAEASERIDCLRKEQQKKPRVSPRG
jgi:hypothetical protein